MNSKTSNFNIKHERSVVKPVDRVVSDDGVLNLSRSSRIYRTRRIAAAIRKSHGYIHDGKIEIVFKVPNGFLDITHY